MTEQQIVRFLSKIEVLADGCWRWTGALTSGYGRICFGALRKGTSQRRQFAHRVSYAHFIGELPPHVWGGLQLDHLCRNRACVNPTHLELVTPKVNIRRGLTGIHLRAPENLEKMAAAKRGKPRPWTPEWKAKLAAAKLRGREKAA